MVKTMQKWPLSNPQGLVSSDVSHRALKYTEQKGSAGKSQHFCIKARNIFPVGWEILTAYRTSMLSHFSVQ